MADDITLEPVCTRDELIGMQRAVETVHVDRSVGLYMVDLVTATRSHGQVQVGASPRGTLALLKLARCRAVLDGRDFVSPDDVKAIAVPALGHRLTLRPELWVRRISRRRHRPRGARGGADAGGPARVGAGAVTRIPAAKLRGYAVLTAALVWAAIGLHRPELVAVAAPFGLLLVDRPGRDRAAAAHGRARRGRGPRGRGRHDHAAPELDGRGAGARRGSRSRRTRRQGCARPRRTRVLRLEAGAPAAVATELALRALGRLPGRAACRCARPGRSAWSRFEQVVDAAVRVRVYPRPESVRALPRPAATHVGAGELRHPHPRARGSSSPTCARTSPATGCARSTGG